VGHVARMAEVRTAYTILVGNPERPTRRKLEDNIRMDVRVVGWEDVDWIHLAKDRDRWRPLVNTVMKLSVP